MATRNVLESVTEHCEDKVSDAITDLIDALDGMEAVRRALKGVSVVDVTYSGPVTVIRWSDGVVTRTRCQEGDEYDREKGMLYCLVKRAFPEWRELMLNHCWKESGDE